MGPEAVWCYQHNTCTGQVSLRFIEQSAECVGRSGGVPDRQTVCAWISTDTPSVHGLPKIILSL